MPPTIGTPPAPTGRGEDAKLFLESHGLVANTPTIRSSDYEKALSCPFQYYLSRRLGLVPRFTWSKALSRGSWFHTACELDGDRSKVEALVEKRQEELREICKAGGITTERGIKEAQAIELNDARTALAWFHAANSVEIPIEKQPGRLIKMTMGEYLSQEKWVRVADECVVRIHHPRWPGTTLVAQFDRLLYNQDQNKLWVVDFKTTALSPLTRLQTCPIEYQTQHYLFVLSEMVTKGAVQEKWALPDDVQVGGMIHVAIQKPSISLGMKDRDYKEEKHTLTRGPRKGEIEVRRTYHGEPKFDNYLDRCREWYLGKGEYEGAWAKRSADPPVNMSFSTPAILDEDWLDEYYNRTDFIHGLATINPRPCNFLRSSRSMTGSTRDLTPYAPFYVCKVGDWPRIVQKEGLIVEHRDENLEPQLEG